jgi:Mn-dependent DtxR family transcriptional regulator
MPRKEAKWLLRLKQFLERLLRRLMKIEAEEATVSAKPVR